MKTFSAYLTEASGTYPHIRAAAERWHPGYGNKNIDTLVRDIDTYARKEIPNALYKDIKDDLTRVIGHVFDMHEDPDLNDMIEWRRERSEWTITYEIEQPGQINHVAGKLKKAQAALPSATRSGGDIGANDVIYLNWLISRAREVMPLITKLESMTPVKRAPKAPEDVQQKYISPMVSREDGKAVYDVLFRLTEKLKKEYADMVAAGYIKRVQNYVADVRKGRERDRAHGGILSIQKLWDIRRVLSEIERTPKSKYKAIAKEIASEEADVMQQQFLVKNAKKLGSIVIAKKVGLKVGGKPKILSATASRGALEGDIAIEFADKSSFRVTNKIIIKYTTYGRPFPQFPTTFHDVILPGGVRMRQPSEERMNTIFVKGKQ